MATNSYCLQTKTTRWRRLIISAGLAFAAAFLLSLVMSASAKAQCMSVIQCDGDGNWQRMMANANFNESGFLNLAADQEAARENWQASSLYREAATNKFNEGRIWEIAADDSFRRYAFFGSLDIGYDSDPFRSGGAALRAAKHVCTKTWARHVCDAVKGMVIEGVFRWVWDMATASRHCVRQRPRYNIDPSRGNITGVWHECLKWS